MHKAVYLGLDTSGYTTSVAAVDDDGRVLAAKRQLLAVKSGQQGLRQSEALFQHIAGLPRLMEKISLPGIAGLLRGIGASSQPRPDPGSYMPVFLAGYGLARSLAAVLEIPLHTLSHQENHLWAALAAAAGPRSSPFLAAHVSGGTTDILLVRRDDYVFDSERLSCSLDLHAGQFIDRVGVRLGLKFPAGPGLEQLAKYSCSQLRLPSAVREGQLSFSGPCTQALRLASTEAAADLARAVLLCIARSLEKALRWHHQKTQCSAVLLFGGVLANERIRSELRQRLPFLDLYFAGPEYSTDHAVGAAVAAWARFSPKPWESLLFSP